MIPVPYEILRSLLPIAVSETDSKKKRADWPLELILIRDGYISACNGYVAIEQPINTQLTAYIDPWCVKDCKEDMCVIPEAPKYIYFWGIFGHAVYADLYGDYPPMELLRSKVEPTAIITIHSMVLEAAIYSTPGTGVLFEVKEDRTLIVENTEIPMACKGSPCKIRVMKDQLCLLLSAFGMSDLRIAIIGSRKPMYIKSGNWVSMIMPVEL